jgi:hypothetical protein
MEKITTLLPKVFQAQPAEQQKIQRENNPAKKALIPQKPSKWLHVVTLINRIGAIISEIFQPSDNLDRFNRSVETIRETRWRSFNQ